LGQTWNQGSDNNRFRRPSGMDFDDTGRLYIVDDDNSSLELL
jgi:secreted PhoX family phosphatase